MRYLSDYYTHINEGLIMSMDGNKLSEILKRYIEPSYYVEGPFGPYGESIEIRFNNKERAYNNKIKNIIITSGWYASKLNGIRFNEGDVVIGVVEFKPKFGFGYVDKIPRKLYHISPSKYDDKISTQGIKPSSGGKVDDYPDRIYVTDKVNILKSLSKDLSIYSGEKEYTVWMIDTNKINTNFKLNIDSTVLYMHSYYIQGTNIPPNAITKIDDISL